LIKLLGLLTPDFQERRRFCIDRSVGLWLIWPGQVRPPGRIDRRAFFVAAAGNADDLMLAPPGRGCDPPLGGKRLKRRNAETPKRRNAETPKRRNAETPKRRNAETPKRRNAETPKRRNAETPKRRNAETLGGETSGTVKQACEIRSLAVSRRFMRRDPHPSTSSG
jgi:hypothetical protein